MRNWCFGARVRGGTLVGLAALAMVAASSAPATAQGMSTLDDAVREKLRLLVEANNASQPGSGEITRDKMAEILAMLFDVEEDEPGVSFSDTPASGYEKVIKDAFDGGFASKGAAFGLPANLPPDTPTNEELILAFQQGLFGQPGIPPAAGFPTSPSPGLVPPKFGDRTPIHTAAIDQAISDAIGGSRNWADYVYYNAGSVTPVMPGRSASFLDANYQAVYRGLVVGEQSNAEEISGTSRFTMTFGTSDVGITGNFFFAGESALSVNGNYAGGPVNLTVNGPGFQGGHILAGSATGDFFGPQAEEFGGEFQFEVIGGSMPGMTEGQFVSQR